MNKDNKKETYNVSEVGSMIEALTGTIDLMNEGLTSRLAGIDNRLDEVDNKIDILQEDVTEIKHKLSEKVDREEFNALEKRLIKLERMVLEKA